MDLMRKRSVSAGLAFIAAFLIYGIVHTLFSGVLIQKENELLEGRESLRRLTKNVNQKDFYEAQWREHQKLFEAERSGDSVLNEWVKNLLSYATAQGLVFTKMEPHTARKIHGREEVRLYLSFEGEITRLTAFMDNLIENDPLSSVESFAIKSAGDGSRFSYELVLGKVLQ